MTLQKLLSAKKKISKIPNIFILALPNANEKTVSVFWVVIVNTAIHICRTNLHVE